MCHHTPTQPTEHASLDSEYVERDLRAPPYGPGRPCPELFTGLRPWCRHNIFKGEFTGMQPAAFLGGPGPDYDKARQTLVEECWFAAAYRAVHTKDIGHISIWDFWLQCLKRTTAGSREETVLWGMCFEHAHYDSMTELLDTMRTALAQSKTLMVQAAKMTVRATPTGAFQHLAWFDHTCFPVTTPQTSIQTWGEKFQHYHPSLMCKVFHNQFTQGLAITATATDYEYLKLTTTGDNHVDGVRGEMLTWQGPTPHPIHNLLDHAAGLHHSTVAAEPIPPHVRFCPVSRVYHVDHIEVGRSAAQPAVHPGRTVTYTIHTAVHTTVPSIHTPMANLQVNTHASQHAPYTAYMVPDCEFPDAHNTGLTHSGPIMQVHAVTRSMSGRVDPELGTSLTTSGASDTDPDD
jgi:hypothetical protein